MKDAFLPLLEIFFCIVMLLAASVVVETMLQKASRIFTNWVVVTLRIIAYTLTLSWLYRAIR